MVEINGTGYKAGVYMTDPLPETDTTIKFRETEVDLRVPADIGFFSVDGKVIIKLDYNPAYTGHKFTVIESGIKYSGVFSESTYDTPVDLKKV